MKKYLLVLNSMFTILIFLIIVSFSKCDNMASCSEEDRFKQNTYSGTIIKKFLNPENHLFKTIKVDDGADIVLIVDTTEFYSFVKVGDLLIKPAGSKNIIVKRQKIERRFNVFFDCN